MSAPYRVWPWLLAFVCVAQAATTSAATYVVLPLIGSQLTIVMAHRQTGSSLGP